MSRKAINALSGVVVLLTVSLCMFLVFGIVGVIVFNGVGAIDFSFISEPSQQFGATGGVVYQLVGSLLLIAGTALITVPLALGIAIFWSEYVRSHGVKRLIQMTLYVLNGVPSIIFGIFALVFFVNLLGIGISWGVGVIVLSMMILPTVSLAGYQTIAAIPIQYRESAQALGFSRALLIWNVLIPQGIQGVITGLIIGLVRAVGETASILFVATAFSGAGIPHSLREPIATLPTHILALAQQATNPVALQNAWGSALVLMTIVLTLSGIAFIFRLQFSKRSIV